MSSSKRMSCIEEKGNQIFALDYHPSGTTFASCGSDHKIRIYDEATKELINTMEGGCVRAMLCALLVRFPLSPAANVKCSPSPLTAALARTLPGTRTEFSRSSITRIWTIFC